MNNINMMSGMRAEAVDWAICDGVMRMALDGLRPGDIISIVEPETEPKPTLEASP